MDEPRRGAGRADVGANRGRSSGRTPARAPSAVTAAPAQSRASGAAHRLVRGPRRVVSSGRRRVAWCRCTSSSSAADGSAPAWPSAWPTRATRCDHRQERPGLPPPARATGRAPRSSARASTATTSTGPGAEGASALAAVTSGDNSNILTARIARETYGIPNVVARIYDPRRAEIYQRLGIPTVATVTWTIDQVLRRLCPDERGRRVDRPTGRPRARRAGAARRWAGRRLAELVDTRPGHAGGGDPGRCRPGSTSGELVGQEGDVLHLAVLPETPWPALEERLGAGGLRRRRPRKQEAGGEGGHRRRRQRGDRHRRGPARQRARRAAHREGPRAGRTAAPEPRHHLGGGRRLRGGVARRRRHGRRSTWWWRPPATTRTTSSSPCWPSRSSPSPGWWPG